MSEGKEIPITAPPEDWTEATLRRIVDSELEESLTLEFKQQLDLDTPEQRREAAKDISSFANTAGGTIVYGIEEKQAKLPGGRSVKTASKVRPLDDRSLTQRLDDTLATLITPRAQYRPVAVDCEGGFCLVVRVEPSGDVLHGSSDRFYHRTETGSRPMTPPDVDRAFERIIRRRLHAEEVLGEVIDEEGLLDAPSLSVFVMPIPPVREALPDIASQHRRQQVMDVIRGMQQGLATRCRPTARGVESTEDRELLRIRRDGVVHFRTGWIGAGTEWHPMLLLRTVANTIRVASALGLARFQPLRLSVRLRLREGSWPADAVYKPESRGVLEESIPIDLHLSAESLWEPDDLLREIMDRAWQAMGMERCDYYDEIGNLKPKQEQLLRHF